MRRLRPSDESRLAAYARAVASREASLKGLQGGFAKAVSTMEWDSVAALREQAVPVFQEFALRAKEMGAAAACEVWDAFVSGWPARMIVADEPGRAEGMVRAAARLIDVSSHSCLSFVGELQRQLQIIYDEAKAVCFDGQTQWE